VDDLSSVLNSLEAEGLRRGQRRVSKIDGAQIILDGKPCLLFCGNNYLGLTHHPRVKRAAQEAIEKYGFGAGASRLVSGTTDLHLALESQLAALKGTENALIYSSGYMTNLGVISALVGEGDAILCDRLNHASLIDAAHLSGARLLVYAHADAGALAKTLKRAESYRRRLILTETIFGMDGDMAPLPEIVSLAKSTNSMIMIDEAHSTAIMGPNGRGALEHFGIEPKDVDIIMGTMSKALGSIGGFACASKLVCDYLLNQSRTYIFTTSLPPAACAAASEAIRINAEEPELRKKLWHNVALMRDGLKVQGWPVSKVEAPIFPLIIGDADKTMEVSTALLDRGFFVQGIRPPTVPKGTSRLRLTLSASHTPQQIDQFLSVLGELKKKLALEPKTA
jgi:8-amino-7-oxononanoate synthase